MELKQRLQDYTRLEFVSLIEKINRVDVSQHEHNRLIQHFSKIVGHPKGADLLFYPEPDPYSFHSDNLSSIVYDVKKWHNDKKQLAFKDDVLPAPRPPHNKTTPKLSPKDLAWKKSSENLAKAQATIQQINEATQNAERALSRFEALLTAAQAKQKAPTPNVAAVAQGVELKKILTQLESAQHEVIRALFAYDFIQLRVQFAKDDALRSASRPDFDRDLQASILKQMTQSSDRYLAMGPILDARHAKLYALAGPLLNSLSERLIRVATATHTEPQKESMTFTAPLSEVGVAPLILANNPETAYAFDLHAPSLQQAIKSAVGGLAWGIASAEAEKNIKYSSVLYFQPDKPGFGEPYAVSTPLSALEPIEGRDWQLLADQKSEVKLKFRMASGSVEANPHNVRQGLQEIKRVTPIYIVSTQNKALSAAVKVRAATWDAQKKAYIFTRPYMPTSTVAWVSPESPLSKELKISAEQRTRLPDYVASASVPLIRETDILEDLLFDDYVVVFPESSEINPVYLMFRGCRDYPGVASGAGKVISTQWLTDGPTRYGAYVPAQVADKLRGKVFKRFEEFREAFWKAVGNTPDLAKQFSSENLNTMKRGHAPKSNRPGAPEWFEINYVVSPSNGGGIYNMNNMRIIIPRKA